MHFPITFWIKKMILRKYFVSLIMLIITPVCGQETAIIDKADSLLQQNQIVEAESLLHIQQVDSSNRARTFYLLGVISLQRGDHESAIENLEKAIALEGTDADFYFALSNAYGMKAAQSGLFGAFRATRKMRDLLEQTLLIDPGYREAKLLLFQFYLETPGILGGDEDRARRYAESFLKTDPSLGHYLLALYWEDEGNEKKTEQELLLSLKSDPENVNVLNHLGYFYLNKKNAVDSQRYFSRAIEVAPETANVYDSMGDFYAAVAEYDSALNYYKRALQRDPEFTVSIYNKARILEALGRPEEALTVYRDLASHFPEDYYGRLARQRLRELD